MDTIKVIIFDLDNTLIYWKDEYISALEETVKEFKINIDAKKIDSILDNLENEFYIISKQELLNKINTECNLNLDMKFVDDLFERQKKLAPYDEKLIDIIKYLSSKYRLILYTNYYHEVQAGRLNKAGILEYFERVYGGDDIPVKPNIEGFEKIVGNEDKNSYIMIGDSIKHDIDGAVNFGIKAILYDYRNIYSDDEKYIRINSLEELKEML